MSNMLEKNPGNAALSQQGNQWRLAKQLAHVDICSREAT